MPWLLCTAYASLFLLREWENFVPPRSLHFCAAPHYGWGLFSTLLFTGVAGTALFVVYRWSERTQLRGIKTGLHLLLALGLLIPLNHLRLATSAPILYPAFRSSFWLDLLSPWGVAAVVAIGVALLFSLRRVLPLVYSKGMLVVIPLLPLVALQGVYALVSCPQERYSPQTATTQPAAANVLWMLFDEFSGESFEKMVSQPEKFPNVAQLAATSWRALDAYPAAPITILAIPSLLSGQALSGEFPSADELYLSVVNLFDTPKMRKQSIFRELREKNYSTAVFGHPFRYCAIYGAHLNECLSLGRLEFGFESSLWQNLADIGRRQIFAHTPKDGYFHERMRDRLIRSLRHENHALTFVHWLAPHPPGVFNPKRGTIRLFPGGEEKTDYDANLVLVDQTIGTLLTELEKSDIGRRTHLILTADHAIHRYRPWAAGPSEYDARIPVLVRFAGSREERKFRGQFNGHKQRDFIPRLIDGSIASADGLNDWLEHQPPSRPIYSPELENWHVPPKMNLQ